MPDRCTRRVFQRSLVPAISARNPAVPHAAYDVTVDAIATPSALLCCEPPLPKPRGISWERVPPEWLRDNISFGPLAKEAIAS